MRACAPFSLFDVRALLFWLVVRPRVLAVKPKRPFYDPGPNLDGRDGGRNVTHPYRGGHWQGELWRWLEAEKGPLAAGTPLFFWHWRVT